MPGLLFIPLSSVLSSLGCKESYPITASQWRTCFREPDRRSANHFSEGADADAALLTCHGCILHGGRAFPRSFPRLLANASCAHALLPEAMQRSANVPPNSKFGKDRNLRNLPARFAFYFRFFHWFVLPSCYKTASAELSRVPWQQHHIVALPDALRPSSATVEQGDPINGLWPAGSAGHRFRRAKSARSPWRARRRRPRRPSES